jgi:hypothetical protein
MLMALQSKRPEPSYYSNLGELLRSLAAIDEAAVVLEEGLKVGCHDKYIS